MDAMKGIAVADNQINSLTICGAPVQLTKANLGSYKGQWSAG